MAATPKGLILDGLKTMTPEVAEALVGYPGPGLSLPFVDGKRVAPETIAILTRNPAIHVPLDRRGVGDLDRWESLRDDHARIRRTVSRLPDGVEAVTESDVEEIAALIRAHASSMQARFAEPMGIGTSDPLVLEVFRHADRISMKLDDTEKGIRAVVTSDGPYVVTLIQAHADRVRKLMTYGSNAGRVPVPPRPE